MYFLTRDIPSPTFLQVLLNTKKSIQHVLFLFSGELLMSFLSCARSFSFLPGQVP